MLTQDEPLPGGYLGAQITAALTRTPHIEWAQESCRQAANSLRNLPIQPNILSALLGYEDPARPDHTHHLAQLTWNDITNLDAILLQGLRHLHHLPRSFPRVALQAPTSELGLNFPSVWEDYSVAAASTWCRVLNDDGSLGRAARTPSLEPPPNTSIGRWPMLSHTVLTPWAGSRPFYPQATSSPQDPHPSGRGAKSQTTSSPPLPRSWTIEAPHSIPNLTPPPMTSCNASPHSGHTGSSRGTT